MENMVVRSILAMFVCLSMAACGQSKGDSAPVHLGNNAKTNQTAGQATATATDNDQTGRQPTTSAQAAADLSNLGEPTATANTTLADGTTSTLNKYADGTKVTTVTHLDGKPATVTVDKSAVIQGPQAQKAAANKAKAVQKSVTAPAGGYQAAGSAAASNKQAAATKKQKENPIATSDDESTGQLNRMSAEADKYTGSADDYLRNFLISKENKASDAQKSRDLQTANSVRAAALK